MHSLFVPADMIGLETSNDLAERWWHWASAANWAGQRQGQRGLPLTYSDWSWPIYDAADATTKLTIRRSTATWDSPAMWTAPPSKRGLPIYSIPWNPSWKQATAEDGGILIRDGLNWWGLLNLRPIKSLEAVAMNTRCWWEASWEDKWSGRTLSVNKGDHQSDGLALVTPENATADQGRGAGRIPKYVGILTADMLATGITSALSYVAVNVAYGAGATFRAPATRVEHTAATRGARGRGLGIPEGDGPRVLPHGTRLVLRRPTSQTETWIRSKPADQQVAARNLVVGLTRYGMFLGETGDGDCQLECEGIRNPVQAAKFAALGLHTSDEFSHFADGLITGPQDLRVVKAAA